MVNETFQEEPMAATAAHSIIILWTFLFEHCLCFIFLLQKKKHSYYPTITFKFLSLSLSFLLSMTEKFCHSSTVYPVKPYKGDQGPARLSVSLTLYLGSYLCYRLHLFCVHSFWILILCCIHQWVIRGLHFFTMIEHHFSSNISDPLSICQCLPTFYFYRYAFAPDLEFQV